jgi:GrpB-like predicted nucleotidyltransferase (UPF0157 family)
MMATVERAFEEWRRRRGERQRGDVGLIELYTIFADESGRRAEELTGAERQRLAELAMPVAFPGFEVVPESGRTLESIEVVVYDAAWPKAFVGWRDRLAAALGSAYVRIEHVGSTSVPGLAAKPVIDIQVSIADLDDEAGYVPQIEALGVQLRSRDRWHRYFRPFPGRPRDVQIHVCAADSRWERDHILFRDYLRAHPDARAAYAAAKLRAAVNWRDDRLAYTDAKTAVIQEIMAAAERSRSNDA